MTLFSALADSCDADDDEASLERQTHQPTDLYPPSCNYRKVQLDLIPEM